MAKKGAKSGASREVNKSQAIRDYVKKHPGEGPSAVATALNAREGWKISAAYVSTIKNKSKQKPTSSRRASVSRKKKAGGVDWNSLMQAQDFAATAGGINQAKAALDLLARLTG